MAFGKLLVAIDINDPEGSEQLVAATRSLVAGSTANVHLVFVAPSLPTRYSRYLRAEFASDVRAEGLEELAKWAAALDLTPEAVSVEVRQGAVAAKVLAQATEHRVDLIVVGSHKSGLVQRLIGSNATAILRDAQCNVFVVKHSG